MNGATFVRGSHGSNERLRPTMLARYWIYCGSSSVDTSRLARSSTGSPWSDVPELQLSSIIRQLHGRARSTQDSDVSSSGSDQRIAPQVRRRRTRRRAAGDRSCWRCAGVAVGLLFPKFEATALLQFPEPQKSAERPGEPRLPEQRPLDPKANVIELAAYKRVAASYDSAAQLGAYLEAAGLSSRPGAARLLKQAENPSFWDKVAAPVLPFSRRDQKEFGDIKDASATTMLGLELTADARTESVAQDIVDLLASYYINAVVRERVRAWTLAGKVDAQSLEKGVRADILRAELDIELYGRRADDMKAVLARYPDAARMDSRQVVSVNHVRRRRALPVAAGAAGGCRERHFAAARDDSSLAAGTQAEDRPRAVLLRVQAPCSTVRSTLPSCSPNSRRWRQRRFLTRKPRRSGTRRLRCGSTAHSTTSR